MILLNYNIINELTSPTASCPGTKGIHAIVFATEINLKMQQPKYFLTLPPLVEGDI
jgi:hypothetical protein